MRDAGVKVGLGVDGSACNDAGNLVPEARQAMLLQRVSRGADAMSAREALEIATLGGAQVLGRGDCGALEVGKRADIAIWDVSGIEAAGSWDPVAQFDPVRADPGARSVCRGPRGGAGRADGDDRPAARDRAAEPLGAGLGLSRR